MKRKIKDVIDLKSHESLVTVSFDDSIFEALSKMHHHGLGALPVMNNNKLVGMISERDFTRASLQLKISLFSAVQSIMTTTVYYVDPNYSLEDCMKIMSKMHIRHLPVLVDGELQAMIGMRKIMEILVADRNNEIQQLVNYISGSTNLEQLKDTESDFYAPPKQINTSARLEML